jgi:hypothetical protein
MAYFLGRDCAVYITTEDTGTASHALVSDAGAVTFAAATGSLNIFAYPVSTATGSMAQVADMTGVDLSIGAMDEDITYVGMRSVTKAEIKKETTISLTRKKSDITYDAIFNSGGRYGCASTVAYDGLQEPTTQTGYRLHVVLGSGDVFSVRGCCVQSHTASVNADGTTEETMEFMSYITPTVSNAASDSVIGPGTL